MTTRALLAAAMLLLNTTTTSMAQPIDSATEFTKAAGAGDTARLTAYLARGFNINSQNSEKGTTALYESITGFRLSTTKYLLARKADANVKDLSGTTALMRAAWQPDARMVQDLLAAGGDPKLSDTAGNTVLSDARYSVSIRRLVAAGADVNQANNKGETPILRAVGRHSLDPVVALLDLGADPNRANLAGETPLSIAVRENELEMAQALINHGARVNVQDAQQITPLMQAAGLGHRDMVSLLLVAGADPNLQDAQGKSASAHALDSGHSNIETQIGIASLVKRDFPVSQTMMFVAASIGDTTTLVRCLAAGVPPDAVDGESGLTAMEMAASYGHAQIIDCLFKRNAPLNLRGMPEREYIPLRTAVSAGHLDAINMLISRGADVLDVLRQNGGLVNEAAGNGDREVVEALIAGAAPLNVRDMWGKRALDRSLERGDTDVVAILRAAGAREGNPPAGMPDPATVFPNGRPTEATTLDVVQPIDRDPALQAQLFSAAEYGDVATVQGLLAAGVPVDAPLWALGDATALIAAAHYGQDAVVTALVSRGAELEIENAGGVTALMAAIFNQQDGTAKVLLKAGAKPNTVTRMGHTALIAACSTSNIAAVNMLLDAGADPGLGLEHKGTPLIMSVKRQNKEIVKLLLAKGADVNGPGIWGMTPLVEAALARNTEIAKTLLDAGARVDPPMKRGWKRESPMKIATESNDKEMVKLLEKAEKKQKNK